MRAGRLLVAVLAGAALAGCSDPAPAPKTLSASSFVGQPITDAFQAIGYVQPGQPPAGLGVTTYNMTSAVSPDPSVGLPGNDWIVIASCYTDAPIPNGPNTPAPRLALGAVPTKYATPAVKTQAQQGAYSGKLTECPSTSDTFSLQAS